MKSLILFVALYAQCFFQNQNLSEQKVNMLNQEKTKGVWQIPEAERIIVEGNLLITSGNYLFSFDGTYLTLLLPPARNWVYRSADDIYMLKTKWQGNKLYYLPPFGEWNYLADFNDGQFTKEDQNHIWTYKKISEEDLENADKVLTKSKRSLHDYTIKPME